MTVAPVSSQTGRSWLRPHVSAIVVAMFIALALGFWNLAGRRAEGKWHFGWPWEYGTCASRYGMDVPADWQQSFLWQDADVIWEISRLLLAIDAAACVSLVLVSATLFELWRRQRRRLWQIYLRELLLLCTLIAIALGVWTRAVSDARRTGTSIKRMNFGKGGGISLEHGLPQAIREFLPGDRVKPFDHLASASSGVAGGHFTHDDLQFLATQPHLRRVFAFGGTPAGSVAQLKACPRLETIWVRGNLADNDFHALTGLGCLRELMILGGVLPPAALEACGRMEQLEHLNLHGRILGVRTINGEFIDLPTAKARNDKGDAEWLNADLTHLRKLKRLKRLELLSMDLANDSLQSLSKIESLKSLRLSGCKFDSADWEELRALRPDLEIDYHD